MLHRCHARWPQPNDSAGRHGYGERCQLRAGIQTCHARQVVRTRPRCWHGGCFSATCDLLPSVRGLWRRPHPCRPATQGARQAHCTVRGSTRSKRSTSAYLDRLAVLRVHLGVASSGEALLSLRLVLTSSAFRSAASKRPADKAALSSCDATKTSGTESCKKHATAQNMIC